MYLSFKLDKSPAYIFGQLSNMEQFATMHPVITKILHKGDNRYIVYERLKLGFIPISFTYPATIDADPETQTVVMKATVMKLAYMEMTFSLEPSNGYTIVNEKISFRSPLPLHTLMMNTLRKQHTLLFEHMNKAK